MKVIIKAYAKLNLTLSLCGMYDRTYHKLNSLVTTVDVSDTLTIAKRQDKQVNVTIDGRKDVFTNTSSLARTIIDKFLLTGVDIDITKGIDIMGGMGGSSAILSAVIVAMSTLFNLPIEQMLQIAKSYGSDIVYLIKGGLALLSGKGDDLKSFVCKNKLYFTVLSGVKLSTADVFCQYDLLNDKQNFNHALLIDCLQKNNILLARKLLGNDLENSACVLSGELRQTIDLCKSLNLPKPTLTGSGGNLFILCKSLSQAKQYANVLVSKGIRAYSATSTDCGNQLVVID
ncbi:MAG: hypothetical protein RR248_04905 [Clostridia bacterium]